MAKDMLECTDGIQSQRCDVEEKRQLQVRLNKLES